MAVDGRRTGCYRGKIGFCWSSDHRGAKQKTRACNVCMIGQFEWIVGVTRYVLSKNIGVIQIIIRYRQEKMDCTIQNKARQLINGLGKNAGKEVDEKKVEQ